MPLNTGAAYTALYAPKSAQKHGIPSTPRWELAALTESRMGVAPRPSGPLARLPSSLADTLDVEQLHQTCSTEPSNSLPAGGPHSPAGTPFTATALTNHYPHGFTSLSEPGPEPLRYT